MQINLSEVISLDGGHVLWHLIQAGFFAPPTIMVTPVAHGVFHQPEGDAILFSPFFASEVRGQTCQLKLTPEEVQLINRNEDLKGVRQGILSRYVRAP